MKFGSVVRKAPAFLILIAPNGDYFRDYQTLGEIRGLNFDGSLNQWGRNGASIEPPSFNFNPRGGNNLDINYERFARIDRKEEPTIFSRDSYGFKYITKINTGPSDIYPIGKKK